MVQVLQAQRPDTLAELSQAINIATSIYGVISREKELDLQKKIAAERSKREQSAFEASERRADEGLRLKGEELKERSAMARAKEAQLSQMSQAKAQKEAQAAAGILTPGQEFQLAKKFNLRPEGQPPKFGDVQLGIRENKTPIFGAPRPVEFSPFQMESLSLRRGEIESQRAKEANERIYKAQEDFKGDKIVEKNLAQYDAATNAEQLIKLKQPISSEILKVQIARMAGDVGTLTDKDLARYGGNQSVISKAQRLTSKWISGETLNPEDRAELQQIIDVYKKKTKDTVLKRADSFAKEKSQFLNLTKEEFLKGYLNPEAYFPVEEQKKSGLSPAQGKKDINQMTEEELLRELGE